MARSGKGTVRSGPAAAGIALATLSAGGFGNALRNRTKRFRGNASALISSGWSPAAATMARLVAPAFLLAVPAVLQMRGRWALLRREAGRVVIYGLVAVAGGQLFTGGAFMLAGVILVRLDENHPPDVPSLRSRANWRDL